MRVECRGRKEIHELTRNVTIDRLCLGYWREFVDRFSLLERLLDNQTGTLGVASREVKQSARCAL
jgi:hypothetical protein